MSEETAKAMDRNPQQKHELVEARRELFWRIHKSASEFSSSSTSGETQTLETKPQAYSV